MKNNDFYVPKDELMEYFDGNLLVTVAEDNEHKIVDRINEVKFYSVNKPSALNIALIPRNAWRERSRFSINAKRT